jgi:O-antigen ligase
MSLTVQVIIALVVGFIVVVGALAHPIGPAILILASTPFDPLMTNLFGQAGNYITIVPILLVFVKVGPMRVFDALFGTRVQKALFLFLVVGLIAHLIGFYKAGPEILFYYLQKISGFLLVAVVASGMRHEKYVDLCVKALVLAMAVFAFLSMLEFYLGIELLPSQGAEYGSSGLVGAERTENVHEARLRGAGGSVPINRFALQLLLPIGLAMGWVTSKKRVGVGLIPIGCLVVVMTALVGTISRSGLLGLATGAAVVAIGAYRLKPASVLATLMLAGVLAFGASQTLSYLELGDEVESRLTSSELDNSSKVRQASWLHGLRLFADSPIWGVGYGIVETDRVKSTALSPDPHNSYIRVLAFYGILGALFFVNLVWVTFSTLMPSRQKAGERMEYWRPYFLAGLCSLLVVDFFNSYFFDRFMFIVIGFAAGLDFARRESTQDEPSPQSSSEGSGDRRVPSYPLKPKTEASGWRAPIDARSARVR